MKTEHLSFSQPLGLKDRGLGAPEPRDVTYSDCLVSAVNFLSDSCMCGLWLCLRDLCRCSFVHKAQKSGGMGTRIVLLPGLPLSVGSCLPEPEAGEAAGCDAPLKG